MLKSLKSFYWNMRLTKGKIAYWHLRRLIYQTKAKNLGVKNREPSHELPNSLIVSITSFPPRFNKLHLTLKCLLNQAVMPDKVILWVAEEDFNLLPQTVLSLRNHKLFEIKTCEDLKSGKKIIPCIEQNPDSFIVTADDDLYYDGKWLKALCESWDGNYKRIFAHRVHRISLKDDVILPYQDWTFDITTREASAFNFATGCGGVFYPPNSLHKTVINKQLYMDLCPKQDDIWLYWMAQLNESMVVNTEYEFKMISWLGSDKSSLASENLSNQQNDVCINKMVNHFGPLPTLADNN